MLTKHRLQGLQAGLLVLSHTGLIFWMILNASLFADKEFVGTMGIVVPLFGTYLTAIVKYYVANQGTVDDSPTVGNVFAALSLFFPAALVAFVWTVIYWHTKVNPFPDGQYLAVLGAAETLFGTYVGYLISSLFASK